ncbi:hypothetical protein BH10PSE9_BH10PSE9_18250 [soil metagenome]
MVRPPDLSVIVVSLVGGEALARCIERLPVTDVEVVAVLRDAASDPALWARRYPRVRFLPGGDAPVPVRRKRGVEASSGAVVALLEDTSWPERGWCEAIVAAFAGPLVMATAGPVAIASFLSDRCRALAWIEFGAFAPGSHAQLAPDRIPANAMAFRRSALVPAMAGDDGLYEDAVCWRLRDRGGTIARVDGMRVTCSACSESTSFADRVARGRLHGAASPARGLGQRLRAIAVAVGSVFSLTARDIRRASQSDPQSVSFLFIVWLALLESAWAYGLAAGSIAAGRDMPKAIR